MKIINNQWLPYASHTFCGLVSEDWVAGKIGENSSGKRYRVFYPNEINDKSCRPGRVGFAFILAQHWVG